MMSIPPINLALKVLRTARRWSSAKLAKEAGISGSALSELEAGKPLLSRERFEEFAEILGVKKEAALATLAYVHSVIPLDAEDGPGALTEADRCMVEEAVAAGAAEIRRAVVLDLRRKRLGAERRAAAALWERIKTQKPDERKASLEQNPEVMTGALVAHVCDESARAASHRARLAIEIAELAVWLAARVRGSQNFRSRALGYATAFLGNAHRVANEYGASRAAFARAKGHFDKGAKGGDDFGLFRFVRLLDLEASLLKDQRSFPEAFKLLARALDFATPRERPRLLLNRANTLELQGKFSSALADLREAFPEIESQGDIRPRYILRFALATNLLSLGNAEAARALLPEIHLLAQELSFELDGLRVRWLEGRIAEGEGRKQEAISTYEAVLDEFARLGLAADAALAALEASALHLGLGNLRKVRYLASVVQTVLGVHGFEIEELAAVRLFVEAVAGERATIALAREAARAIELGGPGLARALQSDAAPRPVEPQASRPKASL